MKRYKYESNTNHRPYEGYNEDTEITKTEMKEGKEPYKFSFEREYEYAGAVAPKQKKYKQIKEEVSNPDVQELITILRDESFGNSDQRLRMIDILTSLVNMKDPDARRVFKRLGNFFTDLGNEMLSSDENLEDIEVEIEDGEIEVDIEDEDDDFINPSSQPDGVLV